MAVVIRLQGLPIVAGTMDIRHFFSGLTIPDGGVHIVGGENGEAFIVFSTDEDARLGMMRTDGSIKGSKVSLLLSSKTEMQNMIELSRRRFEAGSEEIATGHASRSVPPVSTSGSVRGNLSTTAQGFSTASSTVTTAASTRKSVSNTPVSTFSPTTISNMPPSFNSFSSPNLSLGSTLTTVTSLNSVPPPIPPLHTIPTLPHMPPIPVLPPVSSLPAVPAVSPLTPVPPISHLPHLSALPPFNPGVPPPVGPVASGLVASNPLSLGSPNAMFLNPLTPLSLQPPLKLGPATPDELYVHLHGLPFSVSEGEVRVFFQGLEIDSVCLLKDNLGRNSGRALVKFFSPQDSFEALKRSSGVMGHRFVDISPATERQWRESTGNAKSASDAEYSRHRRGNVSSPPPSGRERARSRSPHKLEFCVYLKGLPYEAENKQIFEFFKNLDIVEDSIYIAYGPNGRATGEGFVEFRNETDYKVALGCHMQYMGSRFIQVHPITKKNMYEKIDAIRKRMQGSHSTHKNSSEGGKNDKTCAHITNIPYNVTKKDIRLFLDGIPLVEESLNVLVDANGNGLGQAVVQFTSEEDARKAERLHRQKLNGRDAFIHLITFDQMKEVEKNPPLQGKRGQKSQGSSHTHPQVLPQVPPALHAFPGVAGDEFGFLRNAVGTLGNAPPFVHPFAAPGNGLAGPPTLPPIGAALGDVSLAVPPPMLGGPLAGPVLDHPGFNGAPAGFVGAAEALRGIPPFNNVSSHNVVGQNHAGGQDFENLRGLSGGGPGNTRPTIVKIQNMPFTVTADEIIDFFYGYQVLPGSVCLQFNEKGLPTGDAMVAFDSHDEAMAAVMDLNDRPIGARKVKITLG